MPSSKMKSNSLSILVIDKTGTIKSHNMKEYKEEELYKKCGFKKGEGFVMQTTWHVSLEGTKYIISMYGKMEGKANMENKYDFPPPIDNQLYFGSCALVGMTKDKEGNVQPFSLTIDIWNKIYEKLFGGFEDLNSSALVIEDEEEEDELEHIPKSKKTKQGGYLKDGFVVDDSEDESEYDSEDESSFSREEVAEQEIEEVLQVDDIGSELSEEEYDYSE